MVSPKAGSGYVNRCLRGSLRQGFSFFSKVRYKSSCLGVHPIGVGMWV